MDEAPTDRTSNGKAGAKISTLDDLGIVALFTSNAIAAQATVERIDRIGVDSRAGIDAMGERYGLEYLRALAMSEAYNWAAEVINGEPPGKSMSGKLRFIMDIAAEKIGESINVCAYENSKPGMDRIASAIAAARFHEHLRAWHLVMKAARHCLERTPQR